MVPLTSFRSTASGPAAFDPAQGAVAAQTQPRAHGIGARQVNAALIVGAQRAHIAQASMRMKNPVEEAGARLRVRAEGIAALKLEGGHGVLRGFLSRLVISNLFMKVAPRILLECAIRHIPGLTKP
jgi:hypothetical protein